MEAVYRAIEPLTSSNWAMGGLLIVGAVLIALTILGEDNRPR